MKRPAFFSKDRSLERGIFKKHGIFEKTRNFKNVMKRPAFFSKDRSLERGIFANIF